MRVRFTKDFNYTPSDEPRILIAYRAGWTGSVRRECGEAAIAAGRAVEVPAPKRKKSDAETVLIKIDEDSKIFAASVKRIKAADAQPTPKKPDAEA